MPKNRVWKINAYGDMIEITTKQWLKEQFMMIAYDHKQHCMQSENASQCGIMLTALSFALDELKIKLSQDERVAFF